MREYIETLIQSQPQVIISSLESASPSDTLTWLQEYAEDNKGLIAFFSISYLKILLDTDDSMFLITWLGTLDSSMLTTILRNIDTAVQGKVLQALPAAKAMQVQEGLSFQKHQVGYYAQKCDAILNEQTSIETILSLIESDKKNQTYYIIDHQGKYVGSLDPYKLLRLRHRLHEPVKNVLITDKEMTLKGTVSIKDVLARAEWQQGKPIPILGKTRLLLGTISNQYLHQLVQTPKSHHDVKEASHSILATYDFVWQSMDHLFRVVD